MDKSLNILQVLRAPVGGLFRHVCDLSKELSAKGHKVGLVVDATSYDAETAKKLKSIEEFVQLGIHPIAIPRLFGVSDLSAPFKVRSLIQELRIDVVHGHGAKGGFHARLAAFGLDGVKKIYTPHGGALHFSPKSGAGRVFHFLERRLFSLSDNIIFESQYASDTYSTQIGDAGNKGSVIHNGLPASEFTDIPSNNEFDFVFVGELRDLKGVEFLLRAFEQLEKPDGQKPNLLIIGDGPHRNQFEELAAELNIVDRVDFVGAQPAKNGFARSDAVIVPSLKESLPYIIMEAVAAGKSVIATDVGGIGEIFGKQKSKLIPASSTEALAKTMQNYLKTPAAQNTHKNRLYEHVKSTFSVQKMGEKICSLYLAQ